MLKPQLLGVKRRMKNRMKSWKSESQPVGWNLPDPMPGTRIADLEKRSRSELEEKLSEVERASLRMQDLIHDEKGLKLFLRYLGTAMLGAMITLSFAKGEDPPWILGVGALLLLVYGFMGQRQTDRMIIFDSRGYDRERVIRALDRVKK